MRNALGEAAVLMIAAIALAGCAATPPPEPGPPKDPASCHSYALDDAFAKGISDGLNEPSGIKPCPDACSECQDSYNDGLEVGLKAAQQHQCAVRRCSAEYPVTYSGPPDPELQAYFHRVFQTCLKLEKLAQDNGRPGECDDADIARLEDERNERLKELEDVRAKCFAQEAHDHPDQVMSWIQSEAEKCVDNAIIAKTNLLPQ